MSWARAGTHTEFCFGDDEKHLADYAWFESNSRLVAHRVGSVRPNVWGLFDLHGNVWELCGDTYHKGYADAPCDGVAWINGGLEPVGEVSRVVRGGSWLIVAEGCRSGARGFVRQSYGDEDLGFRPGFTLSPE